MLIHVGSELFSNTVWSVICSTLSYKPRKKSLCMRVVQIFQQLVDPLKDLSPLYLEGMLHGLMLFN